MWAVLGLSSIPLHLMCVATEFLEKVNLHKGVVTNTEQV